MIALQQRHKAFVMQVVNFCSNIPASPASQIFNKQLIRCASSVGANYRAACRAKSEADFIHKMKIVEEEADECDYWLDLLGEMEPKHLETAQSLAREAREFLAITVASIKTVKARQQGHGPKRMLKS